MASNKSQAVASTNSGAPPRTSTPANHSGSSLPTASRLSKQAPSTTDKEPLDTASPEGHSALEVAAASFLSNLRYAATQLDAQDGDDPAADPVSTVFAAAPAQTPPTTAQGATASLLANSTPHYQHEHPHQKIPPQLAMSQSMLMVPPHIGLQQLRFQQLRQLQRYQQYQPFKQEDQDIQPPATQRFEQDHSSGQLPTKRAKQPSGQRNRLPAHEEVQQHGTRLRSRRSRKKATGESPESTASASTPSNSASARATAAKANPQRRRRTSTASHASVSTTDDAYRLKRARNNEAVRKCRIKKKLEMEAKEMQLNTYKQQIEHLSLQVQQLKQQLAERRVCGNCGLLLQLSSPASPGTTSTSHSPSA